MGVRRGTSCCVIVLLLLFFSARIAEKEEAPAASALRGKLTSPATLLAKQLSPYLPRLQRLYKLRGFYPIWVTHGKLNASGQRLLARLRNVTAEGLDPEWYDVAKITHLRDTLTKAPSDLDLELSLTHSLFAYATDLARGRVRPSALREEWAVPVDKTPIAPAVERMVRNDEVEKGLDALRPSDPGYAKLMLALKQVRDELDRYGEYPKIGAMKKLARGERGERVRELARRLAIEKDSGVDPRTEVYDDKIEKAVAVFQRKWGLHPDGKVGAKTLVALNQSRAEQIRQIEVNLERLRWLPEETKDHVFVDIANFALVFREAGKPDALTMRVIVGGRDWETPVFSDKISYIVVNPTWTPPDSIAAKEIAPKVVRHPDFLKENNLQVVHKKNRKVIDPADVPWADYVVAKDSKDPIEFPYVLTQASGKENPLGSIKFLFPNPFSVYLHGTTNERLFAREVRTFSHGCIRLENPFALALKLLSRNRIPWDEKRLREAIAKGKEKYITLDHPVPIHLFYRTAWVDEFNNLNLRHDVYQWDLPVHQAIVDSGHPALSVRQASNLAE